MQNRVLNHVQNWYYREWLQAKNEPDSMSWSIPALGVEIVNDMLVRKPHPLENPNLDFAEIERLFYTMERYVFRAEILADFDAVPGRRVYDHWIDEYPERNDGNVTPDADYLPGAGPVVLCADDGYAGRLNEDGYFTPDSHPRAFVWVQLRSDGRICIFDESVKAKTLSDEHIQQVLEMGYPTPEYCIHDKAAAELRGRLWTNNLYPIRGTHLLNESIKHLNRWLAPDNNGWRRVLVHPRCKYVRYEMKNYQWNEDGTKPIKQHDHTLDAIRGCDCKK